MLPFWWAGGRDRNRIPDEAITSESPLLFPVNRMQPFACGQKLHIALKFMLTDRLQLGSWCIENTAT